MSKENLPIQNAESDFGKGIHEGEFAADPILEKALQAGFKNDFNEFVKANPNANPEEFTDNPKEFLKQRSYKEHINSLYKKNKDLSSAVDKLQEYYSKLEATAYDKALKDLQASHINAVKAGDVNTAVKVNEELSKLKSTPPQHPQTRAIQAFNERNKDWANQATSSNRAMTAFANSEFDSLNRSRPDLSTEDKLSLVEDAVRKEFPGRFNIAKSRTPVADTESAATEIKESIDLRSIPKDLKNVMHTLQRNTKSWNEKWQKQFLADCKKDGLI